MADASIPSASSRFKSLLVVVGGTVLFLVIVGLVSRCVEWLAQGRVPETLRAEATIHLTGSVLGEILVLIVLLFYLRSRGHTFRDLGLWQASPWRGWIVAGVFTALYLWMTFAAVLRGHAAMGEVSVFRIYNSLSVGIVAGFVEEIFFRGFVMTELKWSGFGATVQVIAAGLLFGVAHSGWGLLSAHVNWPALIGSVVATSILGLAFAVAYIASRRSLMPVIVGHLIMDVLIEPWLVLNAVAGAIGHVH